ncbi:MAG: glycoside hydrolase, partial [Candidatus Saccharimonadales bacterium]
MRPTSILKTIAWVIVPFLLSIVQVNGQDKTVTITIDQTKTYQTISHFGASDAWACQFVGKWPMDKKDKIADL